MGTWFQFQMTSLSHYSILRRNFMNLVEVSMVRRCDVNMALWIASHGTKRFELTRLFIMLPSGECICNGTIRLSCFRELATC